MPSIINTTYKLLKELTQSDSIEVLFQDTSKQYLYDKLKGTKIDLKYLDKNSIIGQAFITKKSKIVNNITNNSSYNIAIDNPFKISLQSQIIICISFKGVFAGMMRFSKSHDKYPDSINEVIHLYLNSFYDIFLNEIHYATLEVNKNSFTLKPLDVYKSLKAISNTYNTLIKNTENPEVLKLLNNSQDNIDSLFAYLNPNKDNISQVTQELKKLKMCNNNTLGLRVLIADDVHINVKILNAMLQSDDDIHQISFAYDGIEAIKSLNDEEAKNYIHILFLDHHMPGKLGSEIAQKIKDNGMKIIIVSITNDPEAIEDLKHLYDYRIGKPFSKVEVSNIFTKVKEEYKLSLK